MRNELSSELLDRFDKKVNDPPKIKDRFTIPLAGYTCNEQYTIVCYRQLDSRSLIPQFSLREYQLKNHDIESIFEQLEAMQTELVKLPSITPVIPDLD